MGGGYAGEVAVPLWSRFMRQATLNDGADWYKAPAGVATANVCRLSGKRPSEACYGAIVQTADGSYSTSSSVYTEYFAKGTAPSDYCHLHRYQPSTDTRTASAEAPTWGSPAPAATPADIRTEPTARAESVVVEDRRPREDAEAKEPDEKKKRGFWSRLFGRGDREDRDKNDNKPNKESKDNRGRDRTNNNRER
jgi:penicillin-binding protein 1A